ncbi:hypothetical protein EYF80_003851 [Liparis tanakae]|uniref:Uncharacterized protein n=1 Tax=Liparis tanakae TaxID=230148 RepID=A0A4Z2J7K9_9TELE|nr:hypothetical protein EYF80_003851 [Liparis tanakae]
MCGPAAKAGCDWSVQYTPPPASTAPPSPPTEVRLRRGGVRSLRSRPGPVLIVQATSLWDADSLVAGICEVQDTGVFPRLELVGLVVDISDGGVEVTGGRGRDETVELCDAAVVGLGVLLVLSIVSARLVDCRVHGRLKDRGDKQSLMNLYHESLGFSPLCPRPGQPIGDHWLVVIFIQNLLWYRRRSVLLWFLQRLVGGHSGVIRAPFGLHVGAVTTLLIQVDGGVLHPFAQGPPLGGAGAEVAVEQGGGRMGRLLGAQLDGTVGEAELSGRVFELLDRLVQGVFNADVTRRHRNLLHHLATLELGASESMIELYTGGQSDREQVSEASKDKEPQLTQQAANRYYRKKSPTHSIHEVLMVACWMSCDCLLLPGKRDERLTRPVAHMTSCYRNHFLGRGGITVWRAPQPGVLGAANGSNAASSENRTNNEAPSSNLESSLRRDQKPTRGLFALN